MDPENLTPEQFDAAWDELATQREAGASASPELEIAAPTPAPTAQAPAAPAPAAAPVSAPAQAEDPFAGIPPALKAKFEKLEQDFTRSQNDWKAAQGRIGALQRELDVAKAASSQTAHKPTDAQIAAAAKSPEKWEAMKQDFPEWGDAIEAMVESRLGALKPAALDKDAIDKMVREAIATDRAQLQDKQRKEAFVEERHPGWIKTVNSPEFGAWFDKQSPGIKQLSGSVDERDAVRLLDLYVAEAKPATAQAPAQASTTQQERKTRLQQAATQKPGTAPPPKSEDEMSEDELWDYEARKRAQARDERGRFTRF